MSSPCRGPQKLQEDSWFAVLDLWLRKQNQCLGQYSEGQGSGLSLQPLSEGVIDLLPEEASGAPLP